MELTAIRLVTGKLKNPIPLKEFYLMKIARILAGSVLAASVSTVALAQDDTLDTPEERLSYTIGMDIGSSLSEQDMNLDLDLLIEALRASYNGEETRLTQEEALAEREAFMKRRQQQMQAQRQEEASANQEAGSAIIEPDLRSDDRVSRHRKCTRQGYCH